MKRSFPQLACSLAFAGAAVLALSLPASATPLIPGGTAVPSPYLHLTTDTLLATNTQSFTTTLPKGNVESGTVVEDVYRNAFNTLDFLFQLSNTSLANGVYAAPILERLTGSDFTLYATDVQQTAGGFGGFATGTVAATSADRKTADTVGFNFSLPTGSTSYVLAIRTNATTFDSLGITGVSDGATFNLSGYEPTGSPVPEPATLLLLATGFAAAAGFARRRLVSA